jgi:hypothetical protein
VAVPWRAILLVYGFTQIAAAFPITPGGLGVVEGSLVALLHGYGVGTTAALATAALYRILTFWVLVPLGWAIFAACSLTGRSSGHEPIAVTGHEPIAVTGHEPIAVTGHEPIAVTGHEPIAVTGHEPIANCGQHVAPPAPLSVPVLAPAGIADDSRCGRVRDQRVVGR